MVSSRYRRYFIPKVSCSLSKMHMQHQQAFLTRIPLRACKVFQIHMFPELMVKLIDLAFLDFNGDTHGHIRIHLKIDQKTMFVHHFFHLIDTASPLMDTEAGEVIAFHD